MLDIVFLVGGLLLILFGASWLTDGASSVAKRFNIPPIVIGLTIVAFGTSAPELAVSVSSAIQGSADLAIGNVVGSNIFNILLIVGCTALVAPITISEGTLKVEIPLTILASFILVILASDIALAGALSDSLSRADGLILLCFFIIFLSYTFYVAKKSGSESLETQAEEIHVMSFLKSSLFIVIGLAALVFGGKIFVEGSSDIARALGVSESVIGLTLVAGGTSLPELATSVVASLKKNPEIAIGNVVGSSLFNIFFVLGCSATITPLEIGGITSFDLWTMVVSTILLFVVSLCFGKRIIKRSEGIVFILLYVGYVTYLIYNI
jgi:cation:H+ antiporter